MEEMYDIENLMKKDKLADSMLFIVSESPRHNKSRHVSHGSFSDGSHTLLGSEITALNIRMGCS
jgi:hypothetical protein